MSSPAFVQPHFTRPETAPNGPKSNFTIFWHFATLDGMLKKIMPFLLVPLLLGGCTATFTNLTPKQQIRNANNQYPVEVALGSRQQTMRWNTIKAQIVVGSQTVDMRPTPLMTNRWEGLVPVPMGASTVEYHYKFDYLETAFGAPKPGSATSPIYVLKIVDQ
jgi:hypothetical protein